MKWNPDTNAWQFIIKFRLCYVLFFPIWVIHKTSFFKGHNVFHTIQFFATYKTALEYLEKKKDEYRYFYEPKNSNGPILNKKESEKYFQDINEQKVEEDLFSDKTHIQMLGRAIRTKSNVLDLQFLSHKDNVEQAQEYVESLKNIPNAEEQELIQQANEETESIKFNESTNFDKHDSNEEYTPLYQQEDIELENKLLSTDKGSSQLSEDFQSPIKKKTVVKRKPTIAKRIKSDTDKF